MSEFPCDKHSKHWQYPQCLKCHVEAHELGKKNALRIQAVNIFKELADLEKEHCLIFGLDEIAEKAFEELKKKYTGADV